MLEAVLVLAAAVADVFRPRRSLLAEIALLRHQLTVLQRSVTRPRVTRFGRIALVGLAAVTPTWRNVLRIIQPETPLRRHRAGFKALWRWRCRTRGERRRHGDGWTSWSTTRCSGRRSGGDPRNLAGYPPEGHVDARLAESLHAKHDLSVGPPLCHRMCLA